MEDYSVIANTGIHIVTCKLEIDTRERFSIWFHEWYDTSKNLWTLDPVQEVTTDTNRYHYRKKDLFDYGYLSESIESDEIVDGLAEDDVQPLMIDDVLQVPGEIYKMNFSDKNNTMSYFENKWLPIPYFFKRAEKKFIFGALNWSRFRMIPISSDDPSKLKYKVLLAFDTRTSQTSGQYMEQPVFPDQFITKLPFEVCSDEFQLLDFCSPMPEWDYIDSYLFHLVHPDMANVGKIKSGRKLNYVASYYLLVDYIAQNALFPKVWLCKDKDVLVKDVDMVVDIGNSRTTALLVEDSSTFNQVNHLQLIDYTSLSLSTAHCMNISQEPFDMRLAFRKVSFGNFGIKGSSQFVYPSFVRLGKEANYLIHKATETSGSQEKLSTMSSPKRYLWDARKNQEEWKFMVLEGEADDHILNIPGITNQLQSDGQLAKDGVGGQSFYYSRRSMMTFAFLEMLVQAQTQINSHKYRIDRGEENTPRRVRRIIVTCPTAMSKLERDSLVRCASDAVQLLNRFSGVDNKVEIIPNAPSFKDSDCRWYYDEATCSQLVYVYGEAGYKYKGSCQEFFNLYGKKTSDSDQPELIIGSLDIGAGTSDLMISKYSYLKGDVTTITPDPLFYDSYYYAGDEMLNELIKKVMFFSNTSAFRKKMQDLTDTEYRQKLRNFFGPDHNGQTVADRQLRRDFNLQYSVPLMYYFLELLSRNANDCNVKFSDVFDDFPPNERVSEGFKKFFGFKVEELEWEYCNDDTAEIVSKAFEPLLKKIATIMYAYDCDIVLLSGRPSSLSPVRNIFLKYYSVSPNRLILLNNYFVGHWYPTFTGSDTGYITNPKTIVAMGALVGYYSISGNLDRIVIDKTKLDENLKSVINYIEATKDGKPVDYFITPEKSSGEIMVNSLPATLNVRQIGLDSYPSRNLYVIDFNEYKMRERIKKQAMDNNSTFNDSQLLVRVKSCIDDLRLRMPFHIVIERDDDDKEKLTISSITDKNGNDIADNNIEINIQSLGADENYWLDTGSFEIQ